MKSKLRKKILIITYHFPPDLSVGAIRPAKFSQYLSDFGWETSILTVRDKYYSLRDEASVDSIESIPRYKTSQIPLFRDIYLSLKRVYLRLLTNTTLEESGRQWQPKTVRVNEPVFHKIKRLFNSLLVYLPDDKIGWVIPAVMKAIRLIKMHDIKVVMTTSPPHSVHLIGLILKKITKKLWIVDFRDPWLDVKKPFYKRSHLSDIIDAWMERQVVSNCNYVISVTPEMTQLFIKKYPEINSNRFLTITNGYDSSELAQYSSNAQYDRFTFTYAGTFYYGRNPEMFLRALSELIGNGDIERNDVRVQFIGDCRYIDGMSVEDMAGCLNLIHLVSFVDPIPHQETIKEMSRSHVLLLLAPDQPLQIPGKLYEYIGLNSCMLAVCNDGATKRMLQNYPKAIIVPPGDLKKMKNAIRTLYHDYASFYSQNLNVFPSNKFEYRCISQQLSEALNDNVT